MSRSSSLRRKLAKFRRAPKRFLTDSGNPALRVIGTLVPAAWPGFGGDALDTDEELDPRPIIEASGLFDAPYYLNKYHDVRRRGMDPLAHYLKHGVKEARTPNAMFDPRHYARQAGIEPNDQPLVHYIKKGEAKGLRPHPRFDPIAYKALYPDVESTKLGILEHYLKIGHEEGRSIEMATGSVLGSLRLDQELDEIRVTILIPVFNNREHVRRCIESVLTYTTMPDAELLLIDDASTEPVTRSLLGEYARLPKVTLLRNEQNLGFTRTVNRGLHYAGDRDVVLLNSDTVVSPRWLESLALVAYGSPTIATATALSDSAGAFSTPTVNANPTNALVPVHEAARLSQRAAASPAHFVPTGNGFCMYMRRDAIEATGLLDDANFPRGYGEENDWCMRAGELGKRHAIALRSYVHHVNAVSFGDAKEGLREDARKVLDSLHPDYGMQVRRAFGPETALAAQRHAMGDSLERVSRGLTGAPAPRVLFVVSTRIGGTPLTNEDLMRGARHLCEPLLLVCDTRQLQLMDYSEGRPQELASHRLATPMTFVPHTSAEYDCVVGEWMTQYCVELVHIRHIAWHSLGLVTTAKQLRIPVVFSFHDFYTMCPSVNLTNGKERWSEDGVSSPHIISPLWARRDAKGVEEAQKVDGQAFLKVWRRRMNAMLSKCDAFVTTSESVKEILSKNLPVLRERSQDFHVIPHGRDFEHFLAPARAPQPREPLRVLVAGNIGEQKGLNTLLELLQIDDDRIMEIHLLGTAHEPTLRTRRIKNHGPYVRKEFSQFVSKIGPHIGFIPTVCPETFCHTLTECWAAGLPVVGSDFGAVGERIRQSGAGWTVDPMNASEILSLFKRIRSGSEDWSKKAQALTRWSQTIGSQWNVAAMAERYLDLYFELIRRRRSLLPSGGRALLGGRKRVALVVRGHFPRSMPTAHVRIATALGQASGEIDYDWIDAAELVRVGVGSYDGIVVCRNAGEPDTLSQLAHQCSATGVPLVVDVDDDLLNVPPDKDPGQGYAAAAPPLRELLSVASLATVSTRQLVKVYGPYARDVYVVPNRLDPKVWFAPLTQEATKPAVLEDAVGDTTRIVYMGSQTHHEDLRLILPALARLREDHDVTLYIIGVTGGKVPPGIVTLAPPSPRYDHFVSWFRSIAQHFDFAVAPLVDSDFNRAKSSLKFMEYAACGLPTIASRVEPYAEVVRDRVDGLLADNEDESWYQSLASMVTNGALRRSIADAARLRAEQEFVCRSCVFDMLPWSQWRNQEEAADERPRWPSCDLAKAGIQPGAEVL